MDISNRKLKKALNLYENGEYEAALKICEKYLEKEYSDEEALYLEGTILYRLGRIDDAIVTWKINAEYNKNADAIKHLASIDKEKKEQALSYNNIRDLHSEEREQALQEENNEDISETFETERERFPKSEVTDEPISQEFIEESEVTNQHVSQELIEESPELTEIVPSTEVTELTENTIHDDYVEDIVEESNDSKEYHVVDTNVDELINSSNTVETNHPKTIDLEEFKKRIKHLESNTYSEENNEEDDDAPLRAQDFKPQGRNANNSDIKASKSKRIAATSAIIALILIAGVSYVAIKSNNSPKATKNDTPKAEDTTKPIAKPEEKPADTTAQKPADQTTAPAAMLTPEQAQNLITDLKYLISVNSIDKVNAILQNTPKDTIPAEAMPEYTAAENFMNTTGVNYYYDNAMENYNNGDYLQAIEYFKKAQPYTTEKFRGPTVAYLIAKSYEKLGDINTSLDYYKKYLKEYPTSESYTPEVLYHLALYYNSQKDTAEAKKYANMLNSTFPSSMYNNDNISKIINEQ